MEASLEELLQALGEKAAENYILRRQLDELTRRITGLEEQLAAQPRPPTHIRTAEEAAS